MVESLKKFGWNISYAYQPENWYDIGSADVLISLVDDYDPQRVKSSCKSLIKIAWPQTGFDRWACSGFSDYDIILIPDQTTYNYMEKYGRKVVFHIDTNAEHSADKLKEALKQYNKNMLPGDNF